MTPNAQQKAANFLNIKELRALCCRTVANMMRGKSIQEIRETFNVKNGYTAQEERAVRACRGHVGFSERQLIESYR